jgi:hypothetical protein
MRICSIITSFTSGGAETLLSRENYPAYSAESLVGSENLTVEACANAHLELYQRMPGGLIAAMVQ